VRYQIPSGTESVVIQFKVEGEQLIPVSKQRILSGETITPEKINLHWVNYIPGRDRYVQSANQLIGKTSRRTLNAGLPFRTHEVSEPVLVEAGNEVKLLFKLNGVELTLACDARQNGSLNEQIVVYCPETQKKYTAIINASGDALWQRTH
jgi:flagella basal body P-ring formation protein FlgA